MNMNLMHYILSPFVENDERWGLWSGISTRPVMPASIKMLFTKTPQKTDIDLKKKLMLTQEDYKLIKLYNMFTVFSPELNDIPSPLTNNNSNQPPTFTIPGTMP